MMMKKHDIVADARSAVVDEGGLPSRVLKGLHLEGDLVNLMPEALYMVDKHGTLRTVLPSVEEPAEIWWVHPEVREAEVADAELLQVIDRHAEVSGPTEVVGWLNNFFGLVAPLNRDATAGVLKFWQEAVMNRRAELRKFPATDAYKRFCQGNRQPVYYVVSRGVALVAHFRRSLVRNMLVPAVPCEMPNSDKIGYQALMPAEYLWKEN